MGGGGTDRERQRNGGKGEAGRTTCTCHQSGGVWVVVIRGQREPSLVVLWCHGSEVQRAVVHALAASMIADRLPLRLSLQV